MPQRSKVAVEAHERHPKIVIIVLPVHIAPEADSPIPLAWQIVVVCELLSLPEHWRPLAGIQGDRKGLQLVGFASIPEWDVTRQFRYKTNQLAVVMALKVLEGGNGHLDWIVGNVMHGFGIRVANGAGIKQVNETLIHIMELRHVLCFVQQSILPCAVGVRGSENFLRPIQGFGALNDPTVLTWSYAARGSKPGDLERLIICIEGHLRVLYTSRPVVEVGDLVVAETIHVVLVQPVEV